MNFKTNLGSLITNINRGFKHRTIEITHKYNKDLEKVLALLIKQGILICYQVDYQNNLFVIHLKSDRLNFNKGKKIIRIHSKVTLVKNISEYKLASLIYKDSRRQIITLTNEGLIVNSSKRLKGGELLFEIT